MKKLILFLLLFFSSLANAETVVVYGTSLIEYGPLVQWLQEDMLNDTVINAGMAGQNSRTGVARFENMVMTHKPHKILIEFLINDSALGWGIEKRESSMNHYWMIERARMAGAKVYLMIPNIPMQRYWPYLRTKNYYEVYDGFHVTSIKPNWPYPSYRWYPDGIHPSDETWGIVYEEIFWKLYE